MVGEPSQPDDAMQRYRQVLRHITDIGASLRLHMDIDVLLKRVVLASCEALQFRYSALYLDDGEGFLRVRAASGLSQEEEEYLQEHPIPKAVAERLMSEDYRISRSYFVPAEDPIWQDKVIEAYFVIVDDPDYRTAILRSGLSPQDWREEDFLMVPLMSADNTLLGWLNPDAPLNGLRPTVETLELLELFANQAAVVIEGARLYAEARRSSEELRRAVEIAQESERLKNHFLMTASHELRTPLTAVQGYLELLGSYDDTLDAQLRQHFITNARRAADELVLLLGNIMDTSRVDQDRVSLKLSAVPLNKTAQAILEILEPTIAREQRPVEISIDDTLLVWADDLRLRQILLNIVSNALKYTPPPTKIALHATIVDWQQLHQYLPDGMTLPPCPTSAQFCLVAIRDWGPGIDPKDQRNLFVKFMRLSNALNSPQRGAGLGLYLCRQLTNAMGGRIWVESRGIEGEGTTFYVALPRC
jgi:signal transduction histidine kinase